MIKIEIHAIIVYINRNFILQLLLKFFFLFRIQLFLNSFVIITKFKFR